MKTRLLTLIAILILLPVYIDAQGGAFNFQGRLNDGSTPANGRYDLQFKLFDAFAGGNRVGPIISRQNELLINGVFSTTLNFGLTAYTHDEDRYLEIGVRPAGSTNEYVVLGARQLLLSVPFAVRAASAEIALNANNATNAVNAQNANTLGGIDSSGFARLNFSNTGNLQISGSVGFGTATPNTKLTLSGGAPWTTSSWTASMNMQNASAIGWEANSSGQRFGIGQTTGGLSVFRTISGFGSTSTPAQTDLVVTDNGDIAQPLERNGMMKALVAVTANGAIARCYDGVAGSASCNGFSAVCSPTIGQCIVTFPFQVSNRFWLAIPDSTSRPPTEQNTVNIRLESQNSLSVFLWSDGSRTLLPFHVFVF